jgi:hypothetical protein
MLLAKLLEKFFEKDAGLSEQTKGSYTGRARGVAALKRVELRLRTLSCPSVPIFRYLYYSGLTWWLVWFGFPSGKCYAGE